MIWNTDFFVSGSKASLGVSHGGGRGEGLSSQAKSPASIAKNPGTVDLTTPSVNTSSVGSGVTRLFPAHLRF